jgi:crotonobetainyl-CoA:carnitine CoA-transferase CaiB-like acyl-CoA transferase
MPVPEPIRVIDMSQGWAGPMAGYLLSLFGAEVIKVEAARYFDWWRGSPHPDAQPGDQRYEMAPSHNSVNRNKRGITLDLQIPEGLALMHELLALADVLVENYPPRVLPGLGLDQRGLVERYPRLIVLSMPAFGSSGPEKDYVGFGNTVEAMAGITAVNGYPDGPPIQSPNAYGDPASGTMGAFAVLTALHERRRTGAGRWIELSELEATIPQGADRLLEYPATGRSPQRTGGHHPTMAPHGVYPCLPQDGVDRFVVIACRDDADWARLRAVLGDPAWARDPALATLEGRRARHDAIDERLRAWASARTHREAMETLQAAGVPAGAALSAGDVLADPHLTARGFHVLTEHPVMGATLYPGPAIHLSKTPARIHGPAPLLGQHTEEVLRGLLGKSDDEIAELYRLGVCSREPARAG